MRRSPSIGKPRAYVAASRKKIPAWVREACAARSGGKCEAGVTKDCRGHGGHLHHKLMRSQGGKHVQENLIDVCRPCHEYIHSHPNWSYEQGYLVRRAAS